MGATRCFWDKAAFGDPHEIILENQGWGVGQGE